MRKIYLSTLMLLVSITCFSQWQQVNNGISNLATGARLVGASDTHLFAVSIASGLYKSNDNGENWSQITATLITTSSPPKCGYYYDGKYFVGLDNSTNSIFYTADNGNTWTIPKGVPAGFVRGFNSLSGNLFAYTKANGVYKSTDGGETWSAANTGLTNLKIASMTIINTQLIVATEGAGVFISSDNGANWVQSNSGIIGSLSGTFVWTIGAKLYYYTISGNAYYSSNNEGSTWSTAVKPSFLQSTLIGQTKSIKEVYRNGSNLYLIAKTQYGISISDSVFVTSNEGVSWTNITDNLPVDVLGSGITEFGGNVFIAYGSANQGIYRRSIITGINNESTTVEETLSLYPNPTEDKVSLTNSGEITKLELYNSFGQNVAVTLDKSTKEFSMEGLPSGIYTLSMVVDGKPVTMKVAKK